MFRFDELSVEISFGQHSEEDVYSEVRESATELHFIISEAALIAEERGDNDLSEEGDFGEEEGSFAILLAVGAETFNDSSCVMCGVR